VSVGEEFIFFGFCVNNFFKKAKVISQCLIFFFVLKFALKRFFNKQNKVKNLFLLSKFKNSNKKKFIYSKLNLKASVIKT